MSCSGGVCAPTATDAVLNAGDLDNLLASGNVTVTTTGSGVQAKNIKVKAAVSCSNGSVLTLDAYRSVSVNQQVSVSGVAGFAILTNDGGKKGTLGFGKRGKITFANLSSQLTINGTIYQLENSLKNLAYDIARKPHGAYALASDYDASGDGVYTSSPIGANFSGTFSGLGNVISSLTVIDNIPYDYVGLFHYAAAAGTLNAVRLSHVVMQGNDNATVGGLAGLSDGTINGSEMGGKLVGGLTGGLVGQNGGTIEYAHASARIKTLANGDSGGLVGENTGTISNSWSTGSISGYDATYAGGLVGLNTGYIAQDFSTDTVGCEDSCGGLCATNAGTIINSYASGPVSGHRRSFNVGGFIGFNYGTAGTSYSTGFVHGKHKGEVGGFFGADQSSANSSYWDTDTSGTDMGSGDGNESGITGLTTQQFQSGLPTGFDPAIWAEDSSINNGLPYLIDNPPPK